MRPLLLLAPLLLTGCALLPMVTRDIAVEGPFEHDGYTLVCPQVPLRGCVAVADEMAARFRAERVEPIVQIRVDDGSQSLLCWESDSGVVCQRLRR